MVAEFAGFLFAQQFGAVDGAAGSFLVQEVHHGGSKGKVLVYLPVHTAEGFPPPVEVKGVREVGVRLAEIAEAEPQAQVGSDVVAGVYFGQYLGNLFHDVAVGVQVGHSLEGRLDEIVVISRLLIGEQGVQVETFERVDFGRGGPA